MAIGSSLKSPSFSFWQRLQASQYINRAKYGMALAVLSNILFAVLYLYSHWLAPLSGTQVFLWRMVMRWFGVAGLMLITQNFGNLHQFLTTRSKRQWLYLLLPTPIIASQLWLFMWAPVNGQAVNTAMGYFLFPLTMVLLGCVVFKEKLSRLQGLAITLAALGVGLQFWLSGSVSWATAWVCLTYPIYYGLRRWQGVPPLLGLFVDLSLIAPVAFGYIVWQQSSLAVVMASATMGMLLVGLGLISALAMHTNLKASSMLPMNTFGMLSYLEPALMFLLSIVWLHETVTPTMMTSFGLIWAGVVVMMLNALWQAKQPKRQGMASGLVTD